MTTINWTARIIGPDGDTVPATFDGPEDGELARAEAERLYGKDNVHVYYPTDMARRDRYVRALQQHAERVVGPDGYNYDLPERLFMPIYNSNFEKIGVREFDRRTGQLLPEV